MCRTDLQSLSGVREPEWLLQSAEHNDEMRLYRLIRGSYVYDPLYMVSIALWHSRPKHHTRRAS
jgi:hypothetical protein